MSDVGKSSSSSSSCFDLVVSFSILIHVDLHFKVRTFRCWAADGKLDKEVIRAWTDPRTPLLLQTLAHKITKQHSSNLSEYLGGGQEERGGRLRYAVRCWQRAGGKDLMPADVAAAADGRGGPDAGGRCRHHGRQTDGGGGEAEEDRRRGPPPRPADRPPRRDGRTASRGDVRCRAVACRPC